MARPARAERSDPEQNSPVPDDFFAARGRAP